MAVNAHVQLGPALQSSSSVGDAFEAPGRSSQKPPKDLDWNITKRSGLKKLVAVVSKLSTTAATRKVACQLEASLCSGQDQLATYEEVAGVERYLKSFKKEPYQSDESCEAVRRILAKQERSGNMGEAAFEKFLEEASRYSANDFIHTNKRRDEFLRDLLVQLKVVKSAVARTELKSAIENRVIDAHGASHKAKIKFGLTLGAGCVEGGGAFSKSRALQAFADGNIFLTDQVAAEGKLGLGLLGAFARGKNVAVLKYDGMTFHSVRELADYLVDRPEELGSLFPCLYSRFKCTPKGRDVRAFVGNFEVAKVRLSSAQMAVETLSINSDGTAGVSMVLPKVKQAHVAETVAIKPSGFASNSFEVGARVFIAEAKAARGFGRHKQTNVQFEKLHLALKKPSTASELLGKDFDSECRRISSDESVDLESLRSGYSSEMVRLEKTLEEYQNCLCQCSVPWWRLRLAAIDRIWPRARLVAPELRYALERKKAIEEEFGVSQGQARPVRLMRELVLKYSKSSHLLHAVHLKQGCGDELLRMHEQRVGVFFDRVYEWPFQKKYLKQVSKELYCPRYTSVADVSFKRAVKVEASVSCLGSSVSFDWESWEKFKHQREESDHEGDYNVAISRISFSVEALSELSVLMGASDEVFEGALQNVAGSLVVSAATHFAGAPRSPIELEDLKRALCALRELSKKASWADLLKGNSRGITLEMIKVDASYDLSTSDRDWYSKDVVGKDGANWQCYLFRLYTVAGVKVGAGVSTRVDGVSPGGGGEGRYSNLKSLARLEVWTPDSVEVGGDRIRALAYENPYLAWQWAYYQEYGRFDDECPDFGAGWERLPVEEVRRLLPYVDVPEINTISRLWERIGARGDEEEAVEGDLRCHGCDLEGGRAEYVWVGSQHDVRDEAFTKFRALDERERLSREEGSEPGVVDTSLLQSLFGSDDRPIHEYLSSLRGRLGEGVGEIPHFINQEGAIPCEYVSYQAVRGENGKLIVDNEGRVLAKRVVKEREMGYFERLGRAAADAAGRGELTPDQGIRAVYLLFMAKAVSHKTSPAGMNVVLEA